MPEVGAGATVTVAMAIFAVVEAGVTVVAGAGPIAVLAGVGAEALAVLATMDAGVFGTLPVVGAGVTAAFPDDARIGSAPFHTHPQAPVLITLHSASTGAIHLPPSM